MRAQLEEATETQDPGERGGRDGRGEGKEGALKERKGEGWGMVWKGGTEGRGIEYRGVGGTVKRREKPIKKCF